LTNDISQYFAIAIRTSYYESTSMAKKSQVNTSKYNSLFFSQKKSSL